MYIKTNKWIERVLVELYSKEDCCVNIFGMNCLATGYTKSIDWLLEEPNITSLTLGDTILLNRDIIYTINTGWKREQYVYLYLAIKTLELIDDEPVKPYTPRAIKQIKIDADYWAQKTYSDSKVCSDTRAYQMYLADHEN
jgi:hypothetical protein